MAPSNTEMPAASAQGLPFSIEEYAARQARVRAAMQGGGADILYVTSPANLFYLTGYEAIWYPPRLPVGLAIARERPETVFFDWSRHEAYVNSRVLCSEFVTFDYGSAAQTVSDEFRRRGWANQVVAFEWSSPNPAGPVLSELAKGLESLGAAPISGDWLVDQVRLYKSDAEIARIRRAAAIADAAMRQLQKDLEIGMSALEVSAHLSDVLAHHGSEIAAMPPLVNAGATAWADTHAFPSKRRLQPGDTVAVDCCAVVDRYHVNLGRTFSLGSANPLAARLLAEAADSVLHLQRAARLNEGPESAAAAAERFVRERIADNHIWWIGGYALGIAFAPSWVGHTYLANDGVERCRWDPGYVSNFENILVDRETGFEASTIDSVLMTATGLEVLSKLPRGLLPSGE